jgi:hypothetical protein
MSLLSKIVAAERRMVFLKNDLSNSCISRLIGGRKISGRFGEFIFCKFLDQAANLLVHKAMQVQERFVWISKTKKRRRTEKVSSSKMKLKVGPYA